MKKMRETNIPTALSLVLISLLWLFGCGGSSGGTSITGGGGTSTGNYQLLDVHGAGAQRSDPKTGDPADWPDGNGPQGDVVRIYNYVRCVRGGSGNGFIIVDTGQEAFYDNHGKINEPQPGDAFYGQDAHYQGTQPSYVDNGDGTVTDLNTGLMWQQIPGDKLTWADAVAGADSCSLAGYDDWRLPTIKELYSLIDFNGITGMSVDTSVPYIDTHYFDFEYGDTRAGERHIDAQYWSSTEYVGTTMNGDATVFGVNFADGRIKGYPRDTGPGGLPMRQFVRYVRGNPDYGLNDFIDNGDGTIIDHATGLMWSQDDSGEGMNWEDALAWVQQMNEENYLGYNDWRLPNAKELQSVVDYTRAPATTNSAAIDPIFSVTSIIDEGGETNYPFFWTGTTHLDGPPDVRGTFAVYIAFGEALGYM
jgi:hypothetical protein